MTKPKKELPSLNHIPKPYNLINLKQWLKWHSFEAKYWRAKTRKAHWQERDLVYSKWAQHMNVCRQLKRVIKEMEEG